jgi:hypothetical protein
MDKENAKKVLEIMLTADGGCEYCVREPLFEIHKRISAIFLSCQKALQGKLLI